MQEEWHCTVCAMMMPDEVIETCFPLKDCSGDKRLLCMGTRDKNIKARQRHMLAAITLSTTEQRESWNTGAH